MILKKAIKLRLSFIMQEMGRHWLYESTHLSNVYFVSTSSFEKMALIEKKNQITKIR